MTRRCSHCSNNGHNSRTCPTRGGGGGGGGLRLFGVRLTEGVGAMKKSASMGCLSSAALAGASPSGDSPGAGASRASGYASDDPAHASCSSSRSERKKGTPWTEEEHRMFLLGLKKLGKGDWRGIAKNFVVSRTPTQVASHAQKYFIRQCNTSRRKRRSSLFDMVPEMPMEQAPFHEEQHLPCPPNDPENMNELPSLHLSLQQGPEVIKSSKTNHITELGESIPYNKNASIALMPTFYPAFIPVTLPFWPANLPTAVKDAEMRETYEIVKPTPVVTKDLENVDEVGMSKLSIGEDSASRMEPTLSLKLQGATSSRQSAFHSNPSIAGPDLNQSSSSPIHAL